MENRPTPDGRDWLSPADIVKAQLQAVYRNHPNVNREQMESLRDSLIEGWRDTNYHNEFKILRLTERIYTNLRQGLYETVSQIREDFDTVYTREILDSMDDNGNPL